MRLTTTQLSDRRRGMILILVLGILTLLSIIALSFVLVADSAATSARIAREGEGGDVPDFDAELAANMFLGQFIHDLPDTDPISVSSALRGHSLARSMFGWQVEDLNQNGVLDPGEDTNGNNALDIVINDKAFTGTGRLRYSVDGGLPPPNPAFPPYLPAHILSGVRNDIAINYTYFPGDGFIRDPERLYWRSSYNAAYQGPHVPEGGVPYTYPDLENLYLAGYLPATGEVVQPSFHRHWLFNPVDSSTNPIASRALYDAANNPNWTNPVGKYLTLRPRPYDQFCEDLNNNGVLDMGEDKNGNGLLDAGFPYPEDATGDVKNWPWAPGGNDSIWIDLGAPVMTSADGRKFKMLFAPLIIELDGRINLLVHGNLMRGANYATTHANYDPNQDNPAVRNHASHQGWGPWEVNPSYVLRDPTNRSLPSPEWKNLFAGYRPSAAVPLRVGKYGYANTHPVPRQTDSSAPGGERPRVWGQIDFNGNFETDGGMAPTYLTQRFELPGEVPTTLGTVPYQITPSFSPGYANGSAEERRHHALLYNPAIPFPDDRQIPLTDLVGLLRGYDTGGQAISSHLLELCPNTFRFNNQMVLQTCNQVTNYSYDLDRSAMISYIWDNADPASAYGLPAGQDHPVGQGNLAYKNPRPIPPAPMPAPPATPATIPSEYDRVTWRSNLASVMKADLNRQLPDYPAHNNRATPPTQYNVPYDLANPLVEQQHKLADQARVELARDLYERLRLATGAADPTSIAAADRDTDGFRALRWLAQLAVNIVDYRDSDRINTLFQFWQDPSDPTIKEYVVGTELPGLLLNEIYVQYDNRPDDDGIINAVMNMPKAKDGYKVNVWAELLNPLPDELPDEKEPLQIVDKATNKPSYGAYKIVIAAYENLGMGGDARKVIDDHANVFGDPSVAASTANPMGISPKHVTEMDFMDDPNTPMDPDHVDAAGRNFDDPMKKNRGFFVVGPKKDGVPNPADHDKFENADKVYPNLDTTYQSEKMSYEVPLAAANAEYTPTVYLRRLANPYLKHNPVDPNDPNHDPGEDANKNGVLDQGEDLNMNGKLDLVPLNPYVTVDVALDVNPNDSRYYDPAGPNGMFVSITDRKARGRRQPFDSGDVADQNPTPPNPPPMPAPPEQPKHTFYRHNHEDSTSPTWPPAVSPPPQGTLKMPFDWLVHLDRQVASPAELLHVSGVKPHLLTDKFVGQGGMGQPIVNSHTAPWFNQDTRLYRFLELVHTRPRTIGQEYGGRIPGRININMVNNIETFRAICDAQFGNRFSATAVDLLWAQLQQMRTPNLGAATPAGQAPQTYQPFDRPFWSLGLGPTPSAAAGFSGDLISGSPRGIDNTLLGSSGNTGMRLLEPLNDATTPPQRFDHRYHQMELLSKIYNNLTTRSNVFAVWVTVGFFEVISEDLDGDGVLDTEDQNRNHQLDPGEDLNGNLRLDTEDFNRNHILDHSLLGKEIGRDENRHVRHRMFAIIDRTKLTSVETLTAGVAGTGVQPINTPIAGVHPRTGRLWTLNLNERDLNGNGTVDNEDVNGNGVLDLGEDTNNNMLLDTEDVNRNGILDRGGTLLTYDPGTLNEETVRIENDGYGNPVARFRKTHAAGTRVVVYGNPGPWPRYDHRQDDCILHFEVID